LTFAFTQSGSHSCTVAPFMRIADDEPERFSSAPCTQTPWQRWTLTVTTLVVALTRLLAIARSPWDWDELQFLGAMREFDVAAHQPHPPGFPLYVLMGHLARLVTPSDFAAYQLVTFLASSALFPLAWWLARELRFSWYVSFTGALLLAFLPNVWFYGGTAFSDVPTLALTLAASAFLLRGCRDPGSFLWGAALLGVAAGFRAQVLLAGGVPFLTAAWYLRRRLVKVAAGIALIGVIAGLSYAGAAIASSSIEKYETAVRMHALWIDEHDTWRVPGRPSLGSLADDYLVTPMPGGRLRLVLFGLACLAVFGGIAGKNRAGVLLIVATFLPFMLFAWFMLDPNSVQRFSVFYVFLHALLAAQGLALLATPLRTRQGTAVLVAGGAIALRFGWWTLPALAEVRRTDSPPWAAMQWLVGHTQAGDRVWVEGALRPYAGHVLADRDVHFVDGVGALPQTGISGRDYFAAEGLIEGTGAIEFRRPRERVWQIARHRYFETTVVRLADLVRYGEGWWGLEQAGDLSWQWMGRRATVRVLSSRPRAKLTLHLEPEASIRPMIELTVNGVVVDRFRVTGYVAREWTVDARTDSVNEITLTADAAVNPAKLGISPDARDLSVRMLEFRWEAAE
jgi:hypothetical protein